MKADANRNKVIFFPESNWRKAVGRVAKSHIWSRV